MGPHPAVAAVRSAVRSTLAGRPLLVACSGGADSLALAAAVAFEAPRAGLACAMITVDHGLQSGSTDQARLVAAIGYELGFDPVEIATVEVGTRGGPEAAARSARYVALDRAAIALDADLLLGHTLDDQAETVLLGLGRGSGPRSIAGMRIRDGRRVRPFLAVRRATTEAACAELGLPVWHDRHNDDPRYQRVRLRTEVLPLLEDVLQGGVVEALGRTAGQLQDQLDAIDQLTTTPADAAHHDGGTLPVDELVRLPRALLTERLRRWAVAAGAREVGAGHVEALARLVTDWHGQGPIDLPGGLRVRRASGRLGLVGPTATEDHRPDDVLPPNR